MDGNELLTQLSKIRNKDLALLCCAIMAKNAGLYSASLELDGNSFSVRFFPQNPWYRMSMG